MNLLIYYGGDLLVNLKKLFLFYFSLFFNKLIISFLLAVESSVFFYFYLYFVLFLYIYNFLLYWC